MRSRRSADKAKAALDQAGRFAARGRFEEALAKHVWFHEHALEIQQSYYGVRLSYALSDWVELGKKYPKALEALKAIRDQKTSRLLAGDANRELFHDIDSINAHLNEGVATVRLFQAIEASQPEFAASIYDLAEEALIGAEEYELASKYLGDPVARLEKSKADFDEGVKYANTAKKERAEFTRRVSKRIFEADAVRIITVLAKTAQQQSAREIQSKALTIFNSSVIRDAFIS